MRHWLAIYDIRDVKRLAKVARKMVSYGVRVQQSVFEIEAEREVIDRLRKQVNYIIEEEDFVVYFEVCERDWQKRQKVGPNKYIEVEDKPFYIY